LEIEQGFPFEVMNMSKVMSVGTASPQFLLTQDQTVEFAQELFSESFRDINRLLTVFANGQIKQRNFAKGMSWFQTDHSFAEKNDAYIEQAVQLGSQAIVSCLTSHTYLMENVPYEEIEAIFFISTSGLSTPSIEARIMNELPFSPHTKRIPIWGLGCAGGASGLARAHEYCTAFPKAKVLVLSVELCSLTFQRNDRSKSNLIGTSLFADGVACALVVGEEVDTRMWGKLSTVPRMVDTQSTLMPNSEDVMGWDVKDEGLYVVFSKDIPTIIGSWLPVQVEKFLSKHSLHTTDMKHFIAHPGGKKVLDAYVDSLGFTEQMIQHSANVLQEHGNMSSATVLYVLDRFMQDDVIENEYGLLTALGPGFSSELVLMRWEA